MVSKEFWTVPVGDGYWNILKAPWTTEYLAAVVFQFLVFKLKWTPKTKPPPEIWIGGCSQYSSPYARYVLFSVSMDFCGSSIHCPNDCGPLQWWVTRLSVTGYSWRGGRREGNFQNRRKNKSWLGYVTPKSKRNIGSDQTWPFDHSEWTKQRFRFRTHWTGLHFNSLLQVDDIFSIKQDRLSFRKTFYDMWIVW